MIQSSTIVGAKLLLAAAVGLAAFHVDFVFAEGSKGVLSSKIMRFVNVRDFGAVGDGKTDDTAAIRAAIASLPNFTRRDPFVIKPIFFPNGIYLVSDTLKRMGSDGKFEPGLAFFGESETGVTLRLKDSAPGFGDPMHPKPLLYFSSGLLHTGPTAGGKDYLGLGEGNDAYQNYVETMTIDTGHKNPGAVGIDYLASNIGALRGVRVIAPDGNGKIGISLTRKWIGPALLKDVSVEGFDIGIDVAHTEYSIVLDGIRIAGSRKYGIRNTSNSISFSNLRILTADGIGIANLTPLALVVGRDARIEGKNEHTILNQGYMNLTGVYGTSPMAGGSPREEADGPPNRLDGVFGPSGKIGDPAWRLPVKSAPNAPPFGPTDLADVTQYGAISDGRHDSGSAIQAAMNSGRSVICFPNGLYRITTPIVIPPSVHRIEGSFATVFLDFRGSGLEQKNPKPDLRVSGFVVGARETPLFLRRLVIRSDINVSSNTAKIGILYSARGALVLSDVVVGTTIAIDRPPSGGEIWAENIIGWTFSFRGPSGVWMRQLNTEGPAVHIRNEGARLWILGTKTEGNMTLLENTNGAVSELFGGLAYMVHADANRIPYLRNVDGDVTAAFAEDAYLTDAIYETFLESEKSGKVLRIKGSDMPQRHHSAHMVPQISTESGTALR